MDKRTADALEHRLKSRIEARGERLEIDAKLAKPLYVQDLEERAKDQDQTLDAIHRRDEEILSRGQLTPDCLRPGEVADYVAKGERDAAHRVVIHVESCNSCKRLVEACRVDTKRYASFLDQLASNASPGTRSSTQSWDLRISRALSTIDGIVANTLRFGVRYVLPVAAFAVIAVFVGPNWIRDHGPVDLWSTQTLDLRANNALLLGKDQDAIKYADVMIKRDQTDPRGFWYRWQASSKAGDVDQAKADRAALNQLFQTYDAKVVFKQMTSDASAEEPAPGSKADAQK